MTIRNSVPDEIRVKTDYLRFGMQNVNGCVANVEKIVAEHGGELVTGWMLTNSIYHITEYLHHAVWRSPKGELSDVTLVCSSGTAEFVDGYIGAEVKTEIRFLPDPDAKFWKDEFGKWQALPSRFVAKNDHPYLNRCIEALREAERQLWLNDWGKGKYWNTKAEQFLSRYTKCRVELPIPPKECYA